MTSLRGKICCLSGLNRVRPAAPGRPAARRAEVAEVAGNGLQASGAVGTFVMEQPLTAPSLAPSLQSLVHSGELWCSSISLFI